jgi:membrane fusion protein, multidrug efflux system
MSTDTPANIDTGGNRLRGLVTLLATVVLAAGALFGATAGVGAIWSAVTAPPTPASAAQSTGAPASSTPSAPKAVQLTLSVNPPPLGGAKSPTGEVVDAFVPGTFTMTVGTTYDVTVYNYDFMPHTWTSPSLNVNAQVAPALAKKPSVTHFTITPTKAGTFQWFCATPCDAWSMSHNGFMRGVVTVTA